MQWVQVQKNRREWGKGNTLKDNGCEFSRADKTPIHTLEKLSKFQVGQEKKHMNVINLKNLKYEEDILNA